MGRKTKKTKAAGKFGAGYGTNVRAKFNKVDYSQRQPQASPFHPKGKSKRIAAGIWRCKKTGKIFAGPAYYLEEKQ